MAIGIKSYRLNRANGGEPVEVTLWARQKDESGPRYYIGIDEVEFDGLSIDGARKVAVVLGRFAALAEKKLVERAALAEKKRLDHLARLVKRGAKKAKKSKKGGT